MKDSVVFVHLMKTSLINGTKPILFLVLSVALFGCSGVMIDPLVVMLDPSLWISPDSEYSYRSGKDHHAPVALDSNENMISVKYLSVGPNAKHEQVK